MISTSPRDLDILYKTLLAIKLPNLKMAAIGRNMSFFSIANKHHHLAIYLLLCFWLNLPQHIVLKHVTKTDQYSSATINFSGT